MTYRLTVFMKNMCSTLNSSKITFEYLQSNTLSRNTIKLYKQLKSNNEISYKIILQKPKVLLNHNVMSDRKALFHELITIE